MAAKRKQPTPADLERVADRLRQIHAAAKDPEPYTRAHSSHPSAAGYSRHDAYAYALGAVQEMARLALRDLGVDVDAEG